MIIHLFLSMAIHDLILSKHMFLKLTFRASFNFVLKRKYQILAFDEIIEFKESIEIHSLMLIIIFIIQTEIYETTVM